MDFLNNLLTAAAGYYGAEQKQSADLELAKINAGTKAAAPTPTTAPAAVTAAAPTQLIPGISNTVTIGVGAGVLLLGLFIATRGK